MITNSAINYGAPPASTVDISLTETNIGLNEVKRRDLSLQANLPCELVVSTEKRGTSNNRLVKLTRRFVSSNATLQTETPYEVSCHLVIRADERYATYENQDLVVNGLIRWLTSNTGEGEQMNVKRVVRGEL